ncbi:MAG: T9SS type A sorting domain-containing protein [Bacteroidales bacterium]
MKILRTILLLFPAVFLLTPDSFCQENDTLKFIFIPHPRSEDRVHQTVLPAIEKIDLSLYDMTLLGGDITWSVSSSRTAMEYCDSLFDIASPNTLWTMGNHDISSRYLITEYTGRPQHYACQRDSILFLVLDVELNASGFNSSFIQGEQLEMVQQVCDTMAHATWLVVLHGRLIWMPGNPDFSSRMDSVAESTKQLDTTNFYAEIFPLLQKVKKRGIQVLCLGGDKSRINIEYSPEDSITFLTSTMEPLYPDSVNDVLVFGYNRATNTMQHTFIPLSVVPKKQETGIHSPPGDDLFLKTGQGPGSCSIWLQASGAGEVTTVKILSMSGSLCRSLQLHGSEIREIQLPLPGMYILCATRGGTSTIRKIVVW